MPAKGYITPAVQRDCQQIIDLAAQGKEDEQIRKELGFTRTRYAARLKTIRDGNVLEDRAAKAAFLAVERMMTTRQKVMADYEELKAITNRTKVTKTTAPGKTAKAKHKETVRAESQSIRYAQQMLGCLRLATDIDERVVKTILMLGIKPMPTIPLSFEPPTSRENESRSTAEIIDIHKRKVRELN